MTESFASRATAAARAIGLYAAGGLATPVIGFLALPVFTRIFTPDDFGVIGLFTAAVGLLVPLLALAGFVFVLVDPRGKSESSGVVAATMLIASVGVVSLLALVALASAVGVISNPPWAVIGLGLATAWANVWVALRLHVHQLEQRPARYFAFSALPPLVALGATLVLALRVDGWAPRVWALGIAALAAAGWSAVSIHRSSRLSVRAGLSRVREVARFGAPLVVHTSSIWVVGFTDRFIVAERESLAAAGIYTVAYSIGLGFSALHEGVSRYFVSRLPEWALTQTGRLSASRFAYAYALLAIATLPVVVPAGLVGLRLLATQDFSTGTELLVWLIPAQACAGVARVFTGYLYVESRTATRAKLSATEAVANIGLTWVLVGSLGPVGAAIATFVTYAMSMLAMFALARSGGTLLSPRAVR